MSKDEFLTYRNILLNTFKDFLQFCQNNHLQYYAAFGTVLGAVRHQGFIPWDDDIDVYMPRKDYERFLQMKDKMHGSGYEIIDFEDKGYFIYMGKFCNSNTTLIEKMGQQPIGVYIDVFPLDYYDDNYSKPLVKYNKYYFNIWLFYAHSIRTYSMDLFKNCMKRKDFKSLRTIILDTCFFRLFKYPTRYLIRKYFNRLRNTPQTEYYWRYSYNIGESNVMPIEWFGNGKEVDFEGIKIIIPQEEDLYLKSNYGDYMQLPPEEKRVPRHTKFFFDSHTRYSKREAEELAMKD